MPLNPQQLKLALTNRVALQDELVLYHGTGDNAFADKLQARVGMNDDQAFRNTYCQPKKGKFVVSGRNYGPGLYLTGSMNECLDYAKTGGHVLKFTFRAGTLTIDIGERNAQLDFMKRIGKPPLWQFLEDPAVEALIKVSLDYYVLRTCKDFTVARTAGDVI